MRRLRIATAIALIVIGLLPAESQGPDLVDIARRAAAFHLPADAEVAAAAEIVAESSALGCDLIAGLPLPQPILARRLAFELDESTFAVHVSPDGSLAQACDERQPNLGAGAQPLARANADSDGDGLADRDDSCPLLAGIASATGPGCPLPGAKDRDGDGTADARDACPDQPGAALADGCGLMRDADGDGMPDHADICPSHYGAAKADLAAGCPADGSGASSQRRSPNEHCWVIGEDMPLYTGRDASAGITQGSAAAAVIGITAELDWYQVNGGWVKAGDGRLMGACYNIALVNPTIGGASGCFIRPLGELVHVRAAPNGRRVAQLTGSQEAAALGRNASGSWLFFRAGWASRDALELSGNCGRLPLLDPARAASGTVHFCPPEYAGFLPPRIGLGMLNAQVVSESLPNRLRAQPSYQAEIVSQLEPRSIIDEVLDGPACNAPHIWWQVRAGGQVGWTVESDFNAWHYYLAPLEAKGNAKAGDFSDVAMSASPRLIHSGSLASLDTVALLPMPAPVGIAWSNQGQLAAVHARGLSVYDLPDFARTELELDIAPSAIAFSPDGRWLAIGDIQGGVAVFALDDEPGAEQAITVAKAGEGAGPARAIAWSKAGDKLAVADGAESLKLSRQAGALTVWRFDAAAADASSILFAYRFPYPLTAVAFSHDERWLAVTGETQTGRAAIWAYAAGSGELQYSRALIPLDGSAAVVPAPSGDLGDFVYSGGDSLWALWIERGHAQRFYHQAGAIMPSFAFRQQALAGAETLLAVAHASTGGAGRLTLTNALNAYAPRASYMTEASALAFSPDGRLLALAEPVRERLRIVGVAQRDAA